MMYTISIIVVPHASTTAIVGFQDTCLKIRIAAAPHDGHANDTLLRFFVKYFDISRSQLILVCGNRSKQKLVALPLLLEIVARMIAERTDK